MRAMTIRNPWARCIAIGRKDVENRSRNVSYRGEIAIHVGLTTSREGERDPRVVDLFGPEPSIGIPTGVIVAVANLVDSHQAEELNGATCCSPWGDLTYNDGPAWHLKLAGAQMLSQPVRCKGSLQIGWTVPAEVEERVQAELPADQCPNCTSERREWRFEMPNAGRVESCGNAWHDGVQAVGWR